MGNYFFFPAARGVQAGNKYYTSMVPLQDVPELFCVSDKDIPPEERAQRKLNQKRIPTIKQYIIDNKDTYVFSALAASIDGQVEFEENPAFENSGVLKIAKDAKIRINDGQHRKAAIIEALREQPALGNESISVVFFEDKGLERSQQMFTDLNKHAVKTSKSMAEMYDSRDMLAVITRRTIRDISFLNSYTDKETDILGKFSASFFTLNMFYSANKTILDGRYDEDGANFLCRFWSCIVDNMPDWKGLDEGKLKKGDYRKRYISTQSVVIQALGRVGNYFYENPEDDMEEKLKVISEISWLRSDKHWKNRAINEKNRIVTNTTAIILIGNYIKRRVGIQLNKDEIDKENDVLKRAR